MAKISRLRLEAVLLEGPPEKVQLGRDRWGASVKQLEELPSQALASCFGNSNVELIVGMRTRFYARAYDWLNYWRMDLD